VACHVAVELGHHPAQPVTAPLHADGAPTQEGNRLVEVSSDVGFGDRWLDLGSGDVVAAGRKVAGGGAAGGENLPMQG
jgi:hypothetical protein